jgi:hypothetical protein
LREDGDENVDIFSIWLSRGPVIVDRSVEHTCKHLRTSLACEVAVHFAHSSSAFLLNKGRTAVEEDFPENDEEKEEGVSMLVNEGKDAAEMYVISFAASAIPGSLASSVLGAAASLCCTLSTSMSSRSEYSYG